MENCPGLFTFWHCETKWDVCTSFRQERFYFKSLAKKKMCVPLLGETFRQRSHVSSSLANLMKSGPQWLDTIQVTHNQRWIADPCWYHVCYELYRADPSNGSIELVAASPVTAALLGELRITCSVITLWISPINPSSHHHCALFKTNVNRSVAPCSDLITPYKYRFDSSSLFNIY